MKAHGDEGQRNCQNTDHDMDQDIFDITAVSSGAAPAVVTREERAVGGPPPFSPAALDAEAAAAAAPAPVESAPIPEVPDELNADNPEQREAEPGMITSLRPQTAREHRLAALRLRQQDAEVQAASTGQEDWRTFDVGKALTALRSPEAATRRKALQRLHLRWNHAQTEQMRRTLAAGGTPSQALQEIAGVVQACVVSRKWATPDNKSVIGYRLCFTFHEEVQMDLLFVRSQLQPERSLLTILHLIDVATRWAMAKIIGSKEEAVICAAISEVWVAIFGPTVTLVCDEESGMFGVAASDWASRNMVTLKFKAPRQKVWIIERHNAMLRDIHKTESQCAKEGIHVPLECTLATNVFGLNSLTVINTSTPYHAVLGSQPNMLPPIEGDYLGARDDTLMRHGAMHRHEARAREIAVTNIIEHNARKRIERADTNKTQSPLEAQEFQVGDLVDVWYEPQTKDDPRGWRGPVKIASINLAEANVTVRYQGHTLDRRNKR